jgi:hypothetical protein
VLVAVLCHGGCVPAKNRRALVARGWCDCHNTRTLRHQEDSCSQAHTGRWQGKMPQHCQQAPTVTKRSSCAGR